MEKREKKTKSAAGNDFSSSASGLPAKSYTTLVGVDLGDFIILGTEGRTTEVNGRVVEWEFVKHLKINENVYCVYAGDNIKARKMSGDLKGMSIRSRKQEVKDVAEIASRLVKKTSLENHLYEEEKKSKEERLPVDKRTIKDVPWILNCILAGRSSSSSSGFDMYTIDHTEGSYEPRKATIAFAGSGGDIARIYATDHGYVSLTNQDEISETMKGMSLNDALIFVKNAIMKATHKDWRSGGRIHLLVLKKIIKKKKILDPTRVVYFQRDRKNCRCPYELAMDQDFEVINPVTTNYPKTWKLEMLDMQLSNLMSTLKKGFDDPRKSPEH